MYLLCVSCVRSESVFGKKKKEKKKKSKKKSANICKIFVYMYLSPNTQSNEVQRKVLSTETPNQCMDLVPYHCLSFAICVWSFLIQYS